MDFESPVTVRNENPMVVWGLGFVSARRRLRDREAVARIPVPRACESRAPCAGRHLARRIAGGAVNFDRALIPPRYAEAGNDERHTLGLTKARAGAHALLLDDVDGVVVEPAAEAKRLASHEIEPIEPLQSI